MSDHDQDLGPATCHFGLLESSSQNGYGLENLSKRGEARDNMNNMGIPGGNAKRPTPVIRIEVGMAIWADRTPGKEGRTRAPPNAKRDPTKRVAAPGPPHGDDLVLQPQVTTSTAGEDLGDLMLHKPHTDLMTQPQMTTSTAGEDLGDLMMHKPHTGLMTKTTIDTSDRKTTQNMTLR
jgi:hypothetical protein